MPSNTRKNNSIPARFQHAYYRNIFINLQQNYQIFYLTNAYFVLLFVLMKALQNFFAKHFKPTAIVGHAPYSLIFKTTNYCWYKCPHCCENSGPDQEKTYIPENIICDYLDQAMTDSRFDQGVVFTGGEIFSSYKFYDPQYVPTLLKHSLEHGIGTDIKTNAGWVGTALDKQIFKDLKRVVIDAYNKQDEKHHVLQMSLSVDKFHANGFAKNIKLIQELSELPIIFHISYFNDQTDVLQEFEKQLFNKVDIETAFIMKDSDGDAGRLVPINIINDCAIYRKTCGKLFAGGRATHINGAKEYEYPQFAFLSSDHHLLTAFDNFGRVTLGESCGHKIATPWVDYHMQPKKLNKIMDDLFIDAFKENIYANLHENIFPSSR